MLLPIRIGHYAHIGFALQVQHTTGGLVTPSEFYQA